MDVGYIYYNDEVIKVHVVERHGRDVIVETEHNELLCIPAEAGVHIYRTVEECNMYEKYCTTFVPQEESK